MNFTITDELIEVYGLREDCRNGITRLIERAALSGLNRAVVLRRNPLMLGFSLKETIRPIMLCPVGRIDRTGVFLLTPEQVCVLDDLNRQGHRPGVLVMYAEAAYKGGLLEQAGEGRGNVTCLYLRLTLYERLIAERTSYVGTVYREIPYRLDDDGVFKAFLAAGEQ